MKNKMVIEGKQLNRLSWILIEILDMESKKSINLTKKYLNEYIQNWKEYNPSYLEGGIEDILRKLEGYKVSLKKVGEHYNDSQLVDYSFNFTNSKTKSKQIINARMSLWDGEFRYRTQKIEL